LPLVPTTLIIITKDFLNVKAFLKNIL